MNIILRKRIKKLGNIGDQISVKRGFARNYLLPNKYAVLANAENKTKLEAEREELEAKAVEVLQAAVKASEKLNDCEIVLSRNAKEENGLLFGSVYPKDISDELNARGHDISPIQVTITEGSIKSIGEYEVIVSFHADVEKKIRLTVQAA